MLGNKATLQLLLETGDTHFSITGFPIHGELITPHDSNDLKTAGYIRADAAGTIKAMPYVGGNAITLNLVAGEFFPCMVKRVYATDTSATPLHLFF